MWKYGQCGKPLLMPYKKAFFKGNFFKFFSPSDIEQMFLFSLTFFVFLQIPFLWLEQYHFEFLLSTLTFKMDNIIQAKDTMKINFY
jgi:hypothetical protein